MKLVAQARKALRPLKRQWVASRRRLVTARRRRALGPLAPYVARSEQIAGWARGDEAIELVQVARRLPADATVVEIGSFLGSSAVLLAGARKVAGSGAVHCVDPFDASGDAHSVPVYEGLLASIQSPMRQEFEHNMQDAGVDEFVVVHQGTAEAVGAGWSAPLDLLFLDGDHSPAGARSNYETWIPFLKPGGVLALHNSSDRVYSPGHDGHRRVVLESVHAPGFTNVRCVGSTTFAERTAAALG